MGDWLQFVVDERVSAKDAKRLSTALRKNLITAGWIVPEADRKCVLSKKGHRPGPRVRSWYKRAKNEGDFTELMTNGVRIETGPFTNLAAAPYAVDLLSCPECKAPVDVDRLMSAVGSFLEGEADAEIECEACKEPTHLRSLRRPKGEPRVVCGNLVVTFYNWPPLDRPGWKKDILALFRETLGSRPSLAWSKL